MRVSAGEIFLPRPLEERRDMPKSALAGRPFSARHGRRRMSGARIHVARPRMWL
jgi:hypothetical protein